MKKRQIRELNKLGKRGIRGHKPGKIKVFNVSQEKRNQWSK